MHIKKNVFQSQDNRSGPTLLLSESDLSRLPSRNPPFGLPNLGNTCFLNAVLTVVMSIDELVRLIVTTSAPPDSICSLLTQLFRSQGPGLLRAILSKSKPFSDGRQHCAHSYFQQLLKLLDNSIRPDSVQDKKDSPLHQMFGVMEDNRFTCCQCYWGFTAKTYARTLSVPIPKSGLENEQGEMKFDRDFYVSMDSWTSLRESAGSYKEESDYSTWLQIAQNTVSSFFNGKPMIRVGLTHCLKYLERVSYMEPSNEIPCKGCKREQLHLKQSIVLSAGTVLVIHFQRYDEENRGKLNTVIEYQEVMEFVKIGRYRLFGVIAHCGDLSFGHYYSYVKREETWFCVNDSSVRKVENRSILGLRDAYLLFYKKMN